VIALLVYLIILLIIFGIVFYIVDLMPMGTPNLKWAIKALVALVLILILLDLALGGLPPLRAPLLRP
jgi:O-antigen/teichoic acid export membrane protein